MMMHVVHRIVVQNPIHEAFAALKQSIGQSQYVVAQGGTFWDVLPYLGVKRKFLLKITQYIPDRRIKAVHTDSRLLLAEAYELKADKAGTEILLRLELKPRGWQRWLRPLLQKSLQSHLRQRLDALQHKLALRHLSATTLAFVQDDDDYQL